MFKIPSSSVTLLKSRFLIESASYCRCLSSNERSIRHLKPTSQIVSQVDIDGNNEKPKTEFEKKLIEAKEKLKWRVPINEQNEIWYSKFKLFSSDENENTDIISRLQTPFDFSIKGFRDRRERKRVRVEKYLQQFVPERHRILGNDLAAAHFVVHRGGSVKFLGRSDWIKRDENAEIEYTLPNRYDSNWLVEAIRCDNMELYYEGLQNIRRLKKLKFLSFKNVKTFDDWSLDRVSGSGFESIEVLDLSGTQITDRGLGSLYRLPTLKLLIVDNPTQSKTYEFTCSLLEEIMPQLKITDSKLVHGDGELLK